jgi:hypothetical protein
MVKTYKQLFNEKYGFKKDKAHSLKDISKLTKYKISGLQTIYNRGVGAYYNNPKSVRPSVKSPQQWSMARVYSAVNPKSKAHKIDKKFLIKTKK